MYQQEVRPNAGVTLRASLDKALAHELLADAGIPLPAHVVCDVRRLGPALRFLHEHPGGVVVKPAGGTGGGIGVTASVRTDLQLRRAVLLAARKGDRVLVEALVPGHVHRLLFLDGGFDLVTTDPTLPLKRTRGAVIEVNGNPGLHHHYQVADRAGATRVCIPVLRRVLQG